MSLGHGRRNSISCSDFSGENVNRQNINRYPKGQWWPFILTPFLYLCEYALVRHLFENRNVLFKKKMSNNAFFFNIAMMKIRLGTAFWVWNTTRASDTYIFRPRRNRKMSRNDVAVDHRCNKWLLNKLPAGSKCGNDRAI